MDEDFGLAVKSFDDRGGDGVWTLPVDLRNPVPHSSFVLPGRSYVTPAKARRHTTDTLIGWGVPGGCIERVLLIVSELVTNSIQHSTSTYIMLEFRLLTNSVVISVTDQGSSLGLPIQPEMPETTDISGRGLVLVDNISARWGTERVKDTTMTVWASVVLVDTSDRN
ncbi:ATP-binding protein [Streptomyces sp. NPDC092307]|uniref:ATP-binding protein n=1 Tax=Streptomyces sp. NPDC092307 TaxID=3366013 RepID=UPI003805B230